MGGTCDFANHSFKALVMSHVEVEAMLLSRDRKVAALGGEIHGFVVS